MPAALEVQAQLRSEIVSCEGQRDACSADLSTSQAEAELLKKIATGLQTGADFDSPSVSSL